MNSQSVFVSYRPQSSAEHARAIFLNLLRHGFDVFMAPETVPDRLVLDQIAARAQFVLVLAPDTLDGCAEGDERVCREVARAVETDRRIVAVTIGGFDVTGAAQEATELLGELSADEVVALHYEHFAAGMEALHRVLRAHTSEGDLPLAPPEDVAAAQEILQELEEAPPPAPGALALEEHFAAAARKHRSGDAAGAIADYSAAIALDPSAPNAYTLRGRAYGDLHDLSAAIEDYSQALELDPDQIAPRFERGLALYQGGDFSAAITDFTEVIRRNPGFAEALHRRGLARWEQGALAEAEADFSATLQVEPGLLSALASRAKVRFALGDWTGAQRDDEAYRAGGGTQTLLDLTEGPALPHLDSAPVEDSEARGGFWRRLLGRDEAVGPEPPPITEEQGRAGADPASRPDEPPAEEAVVVPLSSSDTPPMSSLEDTVQGEPTPYGWQASVAEMSGRPAASRRLTFGLRTDVGQARPNNQDASFGLICAGASSHNLPACGVFVVADGMGGHEEGEKASAFAVDVMVQEILTYGLLPLFQSDQRAADVPVVADVLRAAAQHANRAVAQHVPGGGTTMTAAVIVGSILYLAHIGDTRAYLIANGTIEQLTRDHSLVQRMVELGQLTKGQAAGHSQRNVLYRALGQDDEVDVDLVVRQIGPQSSLLVCSDGLWGLIEDGLLLATVEEAESPQAACDLLVERANALGGPDNISVLLAQVLN